MIAIRSAWSRHPRLAVIAATAITALRSAWLADGAPAPVAPATGVVRPIG